MLLHVAAANSYAGENDSVLRSKYVLKFSKTTQVWPCPGQRVPMNRKFNCFIEEAITVKCDLLLA